MGKSGLIKEGDLEVHATKSPFVVHGLWEKVLKHGPKIHVSDRAPWDNDDIPEGETADGVDGDIWLEY